MKILIKRLIRFLIPASVILICNFLQANNKLNSENEKKDKSINLTMTFDYPDIRNFSEGMAIIKDNNKYGFLNKLGQLQIKPRYDSADNFNFKNFQPIQY